MSLKKGHRLTCAGIEYVLRKTVGGGGSGDVWLAEAQSSLWAVKVCRPSADRAKIERFEREASFQETCRHDYVVPVVGRGEYGGRPYYVMPFYPDTLRSVIDRGVADPGTLLGYIEQIGEALKFAHEGGIAHRDIKPENILVDGASAKLADFGIAHFVDSALTSASDLVGNRDYRAPEQQKGRDARDVGPAADIYALGLIINECFTREVPAGPSYALIEASHPLMSYLDAIVARMLAQSPVNRPRAVDVLTEIRFFEAKKNEDILNIEEALRNDDNVPQGETEQFDLLFRQASEDIWYATSLITSRTPTELEPYNLNWHMRLGYQGDVFLRNLCIQSQLLDLCRRKFDYESSVYKHGKSYKPLDIENDPGDRGLYEQAQAIVSDHPLPPLHDMSGRILKTFASCADYHCREILADARRTVSEVDENMLDAPILWLVKYLASHVSSVREVEDLAGHIGISWWRSATFDENDDDADLFAQVPPVLDPGPVLEALKGSWDVSVTRTNEERCTIMFRTQREYRSFRKWALGLADPGSMFEADVSDLFRNAVRAGGITQLTLDLGFDVRNTLAKVLGLRDI